MKTDDASEEKWVYRKHRGGKFGGVILVTIGVVFLLNNFGFLPWSVWSSLWRFWPLFLILGGLEMLLGSGWLAELIVGFLSIVLVGFILTQVIATNNASFRNWMQSHMKWMPLQERIQNQYFNDGGNSL